MKQLKKYILLLCALTITSSMHSMQNSTKKNQEDRALVVQNFDTNLSALLNDAALTAVCAMPFITATNNSLERVGILPSREELKTASSVRKGTALAVFHIASTIVGNNVRNGLIGVGAITPHPLPRTDATYLSQMAVTWGVGYILRNQLDALTRQHNKKNKLLEKFTIPACRSDIPIEFGLPEGVRRWLPHDDETTQHINLETDFSVNDEPAGNKFSYSIIYHRSDVQVTERMPYSHFKIIKDRFFPDANITDTPKDNHTVVVRSTYDTSGTFWKYYLPGRNRFRDAMSKLRADILDNHTTAIGQSLRKLLPPACPNGSIDL